MVRLTVNGTEIECPDGMTILHALGKSGIDVPHLCDDPRLAPIGACRLCVVQLEGSRTPIAACNTVATEGMSIRTHTPEIEQTRKTLLQLLASQYPADVIESCSDKPFHRYLKQYGVVGTGARKQELVDGSHPYIHVDMSQCIYCYRCVRICDEVQGQFAWRIWNRGDQTRILPDKGGSLKNSSCVSCGACVDTCPTGALEDKTALHVAAPTAWTRTVCPYCGVGCEMNVGTLAGRIAAVKPVLDAPVNKGHLCVKGRYAWEYNHAADRVTRPMIKRDRQWKPVTWDQAIQFVAERLERIRRDHGPDSIGVLGSARATNEDNYLTQKFARVVLGTNNVDCCARVCHAPSAAGLKMTLGTGAATSSFDDVEKAGLIMIFGANPTHNHPIVGERIKQAVRRGTKLIVIDPRRIELSQYADIHLAINPGTNLALIHALAHVIVDEQLIDNDFVRDRVSGFDQFSQFIRDWTPERAAAICGIGAELIREAARLYASTKPALCFHGLGLTEHIQGTEGVACLVNLALLTGNVGKPGAGMNPLRGQNNVQGSAHMGCEPAMLTGAVPIEQERELFEKAWQTTLPKTPGLTLMRMLDAAGEGKLKALWAIGYDVLLTSPIAAHTRQALAKLDLLIVQDMFMNQIAECATVFLPVASSFEKDGTFMNSERRIQRVRKAVDPPGEARADWEIIQSIAGAMGRQQGFSFTSPREIWEEVRAIWPAGRGISYDRIEQVGLQWPCPNESHPGTQTLHSHTFPIGPRASLQCIEFRPTLQAADDRFPFVLTTGRRLYQFNAGTMTNRTPNRSFQPEDVLDICPVDARRLNLRDGEMVNMRSRYGEAHLRIRITDEMQPGQLFTTFHTVQVFINELTGPGRDNHTDTPEYKVVAVCLNPIQE